MVQTYSERWREHLVAFECWLATKYVFCSLKTVIETLCKNWILASDNCIPLIISYLQRIKVYLDIFLLQSRHICGEHKTCVHKTKKENINIKYERDGWNIWLQNQKNSPPVSVSSTSMLTVSTGFLVCFGAQAPISASASLTCSKITERQDREERNKNNCVLEDEVATLQWKHTTASNTDSGFSAAVCGHNTNTKSYKFVGDKNKLKQTNKTEHIQTKTVQLHMNNHAHSQLGCLPSAFCSRVDQGLEGTQGERALDMRLAVLLVEWTPLSRPTEFFAKLRARAAGNMVRFFSKKKESTSLLVPLLLDVCWVQMCKNQKSVAKSAKTIETFHWFQHLVEGNRYQLSMLRSLASLEALLLECEKHSHGHSAVKRGRNSFDEQSPTTNLANRDLQCIVADGLVMKENPQVSCLSLLVFAGTPTSAPSFGTCIR